MCRLLAALLFVAVAVPIASTAQSAPAGADRPFVVEYYYKAKWGHADEFLKLFKKNHYPVPSVFKIFRQSLGNLRPPFRATSREGCA